MSERKAKLNRQAFRAGVKVGREMRGLPPLLRRPPGRTKVPVVTGWQNLDQHDHGVLYHTPLPEEVPDAS